MSHARELGFTIQQLASQDPSRDAELRNQLHLTELELKKLYAGRLLLTNADLNVVAQICGVKAQELMDADSTEYEKQVVHCMSEFQNRENREMILDLIDAYIDAREALCNG